MEQAKEQRQEHRKELSAYIVAMTGNSSGQGSAEHFHMNSVGAGGGYACALCAPSCSG